MQQTKMCMTCAGIGYLKIYPDPNRTICYVGHGQGYLPDKTFDRPLGPASASNPLVALLFLTAILIGCWIGYHQIADPDIRDRKSTRLNSSHVAISYAVFCLKKKNKQI